MLKTYLRLKKYKFDKLKCVKYLDIILVLLGSLFMHRITWTRLEFESLCNSTIGNSPITRVIYIPGVPCYPIAPGESLQKQATP